MTTTNPEISRGLPYPRIVHDAWRKLAHRRLTSAFQSATTVPFNNQSRIVFFSDCHRGDNGKFDAFKPNKALYMHALNHYLQAGFTYVEVGDGDELWYNLRFSDILAAHADVFTLLHQFDAQNRLYILAGNHDTQSPRCDRVIKDGIRTHESILLAPQEKGRSIFVVHGHQADLTSWRLHVITRFLARAVWKKIKLVAVGAKNLRKNEVRMEQNAFRATLSRISRGQSRQIEERIMEWTEQFQQLIICGHTHSPLFAFSQNECYFNTGSCVQPGLITGLEIQNGHIQQIRWVSQMNKSTGKQQFHREMIGRGRLVAPEPNVDRRVQANLMKLF